MEQVGSGGTGKSTAQNFPEGSKYSHKYYNNNEKIEAWNVSISSFSGN
jgi:hypothetical protein